MVVLLLMPISMTPMLATVHAVMLMPVPKMDTGAVSHTTNLGASLRDRATLPSPLRGLDPSGGYPSRLRSLRSLRAPLARRLADAHRRVPVRHRRRIVRRHRCDHRRVLLAPALRATLVAACASLALAGCAGCGHRLGLGPVHPCAARCRLRRAPARAVLAALVRALLRSAPALRSAPRRAVVPPQVRAPPPPPLAACCARLPAAPAAPSATQSPWRLPSAGFPGVDSPIAHTADSAVLTARGGLGFHTRRIVDARRARLSMRCLACPQC